MIWQHGIHTGDIKSQLCCINRFTSLCKNLFNLLEFLAEAIRYHVPHFQCLSVPVPVSSTGTIMHWKWCIWHQKTSAKNSIKLNKFLHSEVNLLIQHIIAQDQDGQNNKNAISVLNQRCTSHVLYVFPTNYPYVP